FRPSRYARSVFISSDSRRFRRSKLRATQPSATCTSSSSAPVSFASPVTWLRIVRSALEFSTATRMRLYISTRESLPQNTEEVRNDIRVQDGDHDGHRPGRRLQPPRARERSHLARVVREHDEREHG